MGNPSGYGPIWDWSYLDGVYLDFDNSCPIDEIVQLDKPIWTWTAQLTSLVPATTSSILSHFFLKMIVGITIS